MGLLCAGRAATRALKGMPAAAGAAAPLERVQRCWRASMVGKTTNAVSDLQPEGPPNQADGTNTK